MTNLQIAGLVLTAFLLVFLVIAYFQAKHLSEGQWAILRLLGALCGALAASFITGEAFFELRGTLGVGGSYAVTGVAGFALFMIIWFFFQKTRGKFPDDYAFSIGEGWTFEKTVRAIAAEDGSSARFVGFTPQELTSELASQQLRPRTVQRALESLGSLANTGAIRPYTVKYEPPVYTLTVRN